MSRVLVISDSHYPFAIKGHLEFLKSVYKKYKCTEVIHLGDVVDQHAISQHEREPDSQGAVTEKTLAIKDVKKLAKVFPKMKICYGNHDMRLYRVAGKKAGIPQVFLKTLADLYEFPNGWTVAEDFIIDDVVYKHGEGYSGVMGHRNAAVDGMQSTVIGHLHSFAGINYIANANALVFGMNAGCLIDARAYAMRYGTKFRHKPIISCAVVIDGVPYLEYMNLGRKTKRC